MDRERDLRVMHATDWLETFAPLRLAESWDNVGLLWGDPHAPARRIMTCLTVTFAVAAEAIERGAQLIVSHHPILFRAVKSIRADRTETSFLWNLAKAGIAVYSPHTAFDNTKGGINDLLAERLELSDVRVLRPSPGAPTYKLVVFAPELDREGVMSAMFAAGAGRIGDYSECSFAALGQGTFFGGEGTNPTIGQAGRRETAAEWRIEVLCPSDKLDRVIKAMIAAHSYEEPAYDVHPLREPTSRDGAGRVGQLPASLSLGAFAARAAQVLNAPGTQFVGDPDYRIARVAVVCGAGDDFLDDAARAGADVLVTGEARFHRGLEAQAKGIGLVIAGHHATERPGVEALADELASAFPEAVVWASQREQDPFRLLP